MERTKIIPIMIVLLASFAFAYYPGESITIPNQFGTTNLVYTIVENSTIVPALDVAINATNITITFPGDMAPDSFIIVFVEEQTKTIYKSSGGGGSRTKYVEKEVVVIQPGLYERNITEEVEVVKTEKEVEYVGLKWWQVLLLAAAGGILGGWLSLVIISHYTRGRKHG